MGWVGGRGGGVGGARGGGRGGVGGKGSEREGWLGRMGQGEGEAQLLQTDAETTQPETWNRKSNEFLMISTFQQNIGYFQRNVDWFFVDSNKRFIHQEHKLKQFSPVLIKKFTVEAKGR